MTVNPADGTLFVGKWQDGEATGVGSAFDQEGTSCTTAAGRTASATARARSSTRTGHRVRRGVAGRKYHNGILYQKLVEDGESEGPDWDL